MMEPKRWKESSDAPPSWDAYVRADDAHRPDPAALARMSQAVAAELGRPELALPPGAASTGKGGLLAAKATKIGLVLGVMGVLGAIALQPMAAPTRPLPAPVSLPQPPLRAPAAEASKPAPPPPAAAPDRFDESPPAEVPAPPRKPSARAARAPDPAGELAVLEAAQRALAADPRAALALTERHRRTFGAGSFAQEREMLAIEASLRLGQRALAERRARAFERAYPSSSHRARLADLLR